MDKGDSLGFRHTFYPVLGLCAVLTACAPIKTEKAGSFALVKECTLPSDQSGTITGRWEIPPVLVAIAGESDFSASDIAEVNAAINTWNTFFNEVKKFPVLHLQTQSISGTMPQDICSGGSIVSNGQYVGVIGIHKQSTWPHDHSAMAITTICPAAAIPLRKFYNGIMEINVQDFFAGSKPKPDLQTIILHEFGHLLGLRHSCTQGSEASLPGCTSAPPAYLEALMYPAFGFNQDGSGEQKRNLRANDMGRSLCLYPDK